MACGGANERKARSDSIWDTPSNRLGIRIEKKTKEENEEAGQVRKLCSLFLTMSTAAAIVHEQQTPATSVFDDIPDTLAEASRPSVSD